jgi:hypothetical protein
MNKANPRQEETFALLSSLGLSNLQDHFKAKNNNKSTWKQERKGRMIKSVCDYIMTTNTKDFKYLKIKSPNDYDSDHRMVITSLILNNAKKHKKYIKMRSTYPVPINI